MGDVYRYNREGISMVLTSLKELTNRYKEKIEELQTLIVNIEGSSSWKDLNVKTSFINTCNSYIKIYNDLATTMENYIKYLQKKSDTANEIENAYVGDKK